MWLALFLGSLQNPLELHKPSLRGIAEKLTNLEELVLSGVDISSPIPNILANLFSLTIFLRDCGLHGEFPTRIFQLQNLKSLSVRFNPKLIGCVLEFNRSSPLEYLKLAGSSFSGKLPNSMGNLQSLYDMDVRSCNFSGPIPSSFANLMKLTYLDLSESIFSRGTLSWVENISLYGDIPFSSIRNLTKLTTLILDRNELTSPIPSWLTTLTQLNTLQLSYNKLCSPIPTSISSLLNLQILDLSLNNLSGTVEFDLFQKLNNLSHLDLSYNNLLLVIDPSINSTFQKFRILGLGSCNLSDFPEFLRNQDQLEVLELSLNNIHGQIPKWISNLSKDTLKVLEMSDNLLTGFDHIPDALIWTNLQILILPNNKLQGSLPIPPPSILYYFVSNNMLSGDISQMICELSSLSYLDVSYNNLSGFLPHCLGDLRNLSILNLQYNNFHGSIPQIFKEGCKMGMITLSQNHFEGPLPRSLANCTTLEVLDIGNNHIIDFFSILVGHSSRAKDSHVSNNNISSKLPSEYLQIWKAMQSFDASHLTYMQTDGHKLKTQSDGWLMTYIYLMTLTDKGIKKKYSRIQDFFVAIDLSGNNFEGEIPKILGSLKRFTCLTFPTIVKSLDLSQNMLVGEIPPQLVELIFLAFLNVSYNNLTGPILQGKQFLTFQNNSFYGNVELCGSPLFKRCANSEDPSTPTSNFEAKQSSEYPFELAGR
ncbi:hypothetical protein RGQ29_003059 [Quercus rubra]|uniref:Uncharacterized protein n=1 Tax=Quercus rubra TaxID=3512 RepID=A0AAN7IEG8_QUERU|nr:hypothetical protein RGQ29_003059 [Quercus rubra]